MLEERLNEEMRTALKAGDQTRLSTLRMLRSHIQLEKKRERAKDTLTDDEVVSVISSYARKLRDSIAEYERHGRAKEAARIGDELAIVQEYLPAPLTEAEAKALVTSVVSELQVATMRDFGRAMKELQARARGRADGKLLSELLRASLT